MGTVVGSLAVVLAMTSTVLAQEGSETVPKQLNLEIVDPETIGIGEDRDSGSARVRDYEQNQRQQEQEYQEIETFMETWGDGRLPPWERRGGL